MSKLKAIWAKLPLFWKDLGERVGRTFVASFGMIYLGGILANEADITNVENLVDWSLADKAATAGFLAVGSLILGLLTKNVGDKNTASTFEAFNGHQTPEPPEYDPTVPVVGDVLPATEAFADYVPYTGGPREFDH